MLFPVPCLIQHDRAHTHTDDKLWNNCWKQVNHTVDLWVSTDIPTFLLLYTSSSLFPCYLSVRLTVMYVHNCYPLFQYWRANIRFQFQCPILVINVIVVVSKIKLSVAQYTLPINWRWFSVTGPLSLKYSISLDNVAKSIKDSIPYSDMASPMLHILHFSWSNVPYWNKNSVSCQWGITILRTEEMCPLLWWE